MKKYYEFYDEISSSEIYEKLIKYGMVSPVIPEIFTFESFYNYAISNRNQSGNIFNNHDTKPDEYIYMRNNEIPRVINVPNPVAFHNLCNTLQNSWIDIQNHFRINTVSHKHKISRIHLNKNLNKRVFNMNMHYNNWNDTVEYDLIVGNSYVAIADLSTFFNSIYTHSLPWALVGKVHAKSNQNGRLWFNKIDQKVRKLKDNETHGILIGPDSSNILSEIILIRIDEDLYNMGYKFLRYIDDYKCFCASKEDADRFIEDLTFKLKEYDLMLNYKKTKIIEVDDYMSLNFVDEVTTLVNSFPKRLNLNTLRAIVNGLLSISKKYNNFAAMNYGLKMLKNFKMNYNTTVNFINIVTQHSITHNYLIKIYEEVIMERYKTAKLKINESIRKILEDSIKKFKYESIAVMIYLAIKNGIRIDIKSIDISYCEKSRNSILTLLVYKCKQINGESILDFYSFAQQIQNESDNLDGWWIYCYEVLDVCDLLGYWNTMKTNGVKFVTI